MLFCELYMVHCLLLLVWPFSFLLEEAPRSAVKCKFKLCIVLDHSQSYIISTVEKKHLSNMFNQGRGEEMPVIIQKIQNTENIVHVNE